MHVLIQKWGNSLALRVPKSLAEVLGVTASSPVEISVENHALVVKPRKRKKLSLRGLVAMINEKNRHEAIETGPAVGKEAW